MATFAVTTAKGPNWDAARGIREQPAWDAHAAFSDQLVESGVIVLGGPIQSDSEEDIALLLVRADDEHQLRAIFAADPWMTGSVFRLKQIRAWTLWLGDTT